MSTEHNPSFADPAFSSISGNESCAYLLLDPAPAAKDDYSDFAGHDSSSFVPASPQKQQIQTIITTPYKIPDSASISNAFTPSSHYCGGNIERVFNNSPPPVNPNPVKARASPFIPFCRENLSPLCTVEGNFTTSISKRVLFSPLYFLCF